MDVTCVGMGRGNAVVAELAVGLLSTTTVVSGGVQQDRDVDAQEHAESR